MVEEYPRNLTELETNFGSEEVCRAYLARLRWPGGFRCPRCGGDPVVARPWGSARVRGLWLPNFSYSRNHLPGYAHSFTGLVPRYVVGDHPEERCQRFGPATSARAEELRDSLGVAA